MHTLVTIESAFQLSITSSGSQVVKKDVEKATVINYNPYFRKIIGNAALKYSLETYPTCHVVCPNFSNFASEGYSEW